jgi:hypothetical protein
MLFPGAGCLVGSARVRRFQLFRLGMTRATRIRKIPAAAKAPRERASRPEAMNMTSQKVRIPPMNGCCRRTSKPVGVRAMS